MQTLTEIRQMDIVVPDLRLLGLALDAIEMECCNLAMLVSAAWNLFDVAVDENEATENRNILAEAAQSAEEKLILAKQERDAIKATLLAVQQ